MTDAEKRDMVIRGLECCSQQRGGPELCEQCPYDNEPFPCANALIRDALAQLKEQEPRWISVNQDKPKKDGKYFVLRHSQGRQIVEIMYYGIPEYLKDRYFYYNDSEWGDIVVVDITHWLPLSALPELPKEEDDN